MYAKIESDRTKKKKYELRIISKHIQHISQGFTYIDCHLMHHRYTVKESERLASVVKLLIIISINDILCMNKQTKINSHISR